MKRFLFILLFPGFSAVSFSQIRWDNGGGDGQWNTAANWLGDVVPGPGDDVLLDNSVLLSSVSITLPGGAVTVSVNSLTISPSGGFGITLGLPGSNTGNPGFIATGPGDAIILDNNAAFFNQSSAGAGVTSVQVSATSFFRINNGGRYIHVSESGHTINLADRLSTAAGTENGSFEFDVPGATPYPIAADGINYGRLILLSFQAGVKTYTASGISPCNVRGSLEIYSNVTLGLTMSANFVVQQDYLQFPASTFDVQSGTNDNTVQIAGDITNNGLITETGSGLPVIELNGTSNQQISGSGTMQNSIALTINNAAGATLNAPLTLPYNLNLVNGKITTTLTNLLTMVNDANSPPGHNGSFIDGPLQKIGDEDWIFPVGKGNIYAPIGTVAPVGNTAGDTYTAEYFRESPQALHGTNYTPPIDHISYVEYWSFTRDVGNADVRIVIKVHQYSFCKVATTTFISRWNGSIWTVEPATATGTGGCGIGYQCFNLTSDGLVSGFGHFTLATTDPFIINPLPIRLSNFHVKRTGSNSADINWELAEYCSDAARFEVQKSADNRNFIMAFSVPGNESSKYYQQHDPRLDKGITYYRLKMTDENGQVSYSRIIAIINDSKGLLITSITPNPVQQNAAIMLSTAKQGIVNFEIFNITGQLTRRWIAAVAGGTNTINADLSALPAGTYHITVQSMDTKTVFRFVKQ